MLDLEMTICERNILLYGCLLESQDEPNRLADWTRERCLAYSGLPAVSRKKIVLFIDQACSSDSWILASFFFGGCSLTSTPSRPLQRKRKELGQYPAILNVNCVRLTSGHEAPFITHRDLVNTSAPAQTLI